MIMKFGSFLHIVSAERKQWMRQAKFIHTLPKISCIEIWLEYLDLADGDIKFVKKLATGLDILVHAPFVSQTLVSPHQETNLASVTVLKRTVKIAKQLEAKVITVHTGGYPWWWPKIQAQQTLVRNLRPILATSKILAWENMAAERRVMVSYPSNFSDFIAVKKELPALKFTVDTGHMIRSKISKSTVEKFFRQYGGEVANIHLHDGTANGEEHLALGRGELDLKWLMKLLHQMAYDGYVNLEIFPNNAQNVKSSWQKVLKYL